MTNYNVEILAPGFDRESEKDLPDEVYLFREVKESEVIGIIAKWLYLGVPTEIKIVRLG